jgi:glucose-1-phosphate cytidylyltransferase
LKVVVLAGGLGTRLAEETDSKPKPMVEIGDKPMLWHILKHYTSFGFDSFVIALGYKGDVIKRFFVDYQVMAGSLKVSLADGRLTSYEQATDRWTVQLIETGLGTQTGGRVRRLAPWLGDQTFMLTYGDGVSNVNVRDLLDFHRDHGKLATICAVRPPARFGALHFQSDNTVIFSEKRYADEGWINGGFMVLEPEVIELIEGDDASLEIDVLEGLSLRGELKGFRHEDFWQSVDTLRDLRYLRSLWDSGKAPWVTWT